MIKTLQQAHAKLTDLKMSPRYDSQLKVNGCGSIISSPESVTIYCPRQYLIIYLNILEKEVPGFILIYIGSIEELVFYPCNRSYQFIMNVIESCRTYDHVVSASRLLNSVYPNDEYLKEALANKFNSM